MTNKSNKKVRLDIKLEAQLHLLKSEIDRERILNALSLSLQEIANKYTSDLETVNIKVCQHEPLFEKAICEHRVSEYSAHSQFDVYSLV
jgi:hypothetical protein